MNWCCCNLIWSRQYSLHYYGVALAIRHGAENYRIMSWLYSSLWMDSIIMFKRTTAELWGKNSRFSDSVIFSIYIANQCRLWWFLYHASSVLWLEGQFITRLRLKLIDRDQGWILCSGACLSFMHGHVCGIKWGNDEDAAILFQFMRVSGVLWAGKLD